MLLINNRVLPLGSVVTLKGSPVRLMIIGYIATNKDDGKIYHYCACVHPLGLDVNKQFFFNMDDIDVVFFMGYQNEMSLHSTELIKESINKLEQGMSFGEITKYIIENLYSKGDEKNGR